MGFLIILIMILFFVGFVFISIKLNNLRYRAGQEILKNTGISASEINAGFSNSIEKKSLQKFLEEHPEFTEETIKDLFRQYTDQLIQRNSVNEFSQAVYEKMQNDSKLEKLQGMEYKRTNISYYKETKIGAIVIYTDNRDEYMVNLTCSILGNRIQLDKYQISKGSVVGF